MVLRDQPIFVVGCPRSGTTLFRTALCAHKNIAIPPENRFVMGAYVRRQSFGDLHRSENREELARWIVERSETRFHALGLDGEQVTREIIEGPPTIGSAIGIVLRAYSRQFDKPRWGDKRPAYTSFMTELDRMFPDAQFIHVVRDPRACVESLMRQQWFSSDVRVCAATWVHAVRMARRAGTTLGSSRYLEVRYEDFVAEPEGVSREVCEFLGEPFDPAMSRPELVAADVNPAYYEQRSQIEEGVHTASVEAWRTKLSTADIALVERAAGAGMREFGYQPSANESHASTWHTLYVARRHWGYRWGIAASRGRDARRRAYEDNGVAALLTTTQLQLARQPHSVSRSAASLRAMRPLVGPPTRGLRRVYRRFTRHLTQ